MSLVITRPFAGGYVLPCEVGAAVSGAGPVVLAVRTLAAGRTGATMTLENTHEGDIERALDDILQQFAAGCAVACCCWRRSGPKRAAAGVKPDRSGAGLGGTGGARAQPHPMQQQGAGQSGRRGRRGGPPLAVICR